MRLILLLAAPLLVQSAKIAEPASEIGSIDLFGDGVALNINRAGVVRYSDAKPISVQGTKRLRVGIDGFARIRRRLQKYRSQATPSRLGFSLWLDEINCKEWLSDQPSVIILWHEKPRDMMYFVDFGCDYTRQAVHNKALLAIIRSVPRP